MQLFALLLQQRKLHSSAHNDTLQNKTKNKGTVTMIMMSGKEFEVSLAFVESHADLMSAVFKALTPNKGVRISILDGERVLSSSNPRLITDDSLLTIVLSKGEK